MSNSTTITISQPTIYHGFGKNTDSKEWYAIYNLHIVILNFVNSEVWAVQRHSNINVTFKVLSQ